MKAYICLDCGKEKLLCRKCHLKKHNKTERIYVERRKGVDIYA